MINATLPDQTVSNFVTTIVNKNGTITASGCHEDSASISQGKAPTFPSVSLTGGGGVGRLLQKVSVTWRKMHGLPVLPNLAASQKDLEMPRGWYWMGQHFPDLTS